MFGLLLLAAGCVGTKAITELPEGDDSGMVARMPPPTRTAADTDNGESWLILPEMPADATQADIGEEIYILVCRDCHGDRGQGLTDEFRATWAPKDQNCWQSKCHAPNHMVEGFELPRYIPAIIGPNTLARFQTANDLQAYIGTNMPWHNPGSLTQEEYWQLTAFILRENEAHTNLRLGSEASSQQ